MAGGDPNLIRVQRQLGVTPQVARLALALEAAAGQVVAVDELARSIAGQRVPTGSSVLVQKCVHHLRNAIEANGLNCAVDMKRGIGYRMRGGLCGKPLTEAEGGVFGKKLTSDEGGVFGKTLTSLPAVVHGPWGAMQAWMAAVVVTAGATGVDPVELAAQTRTGQKRPEAITEARAVALYLAIVGGGAAKKALARVTGFDLEFIKRTARRLAEEDHGQLAELEAEVLGRLQQAHRKGAGKAAA